MPAELGERAVLKAWKAMKGERTTDRRIAEWVNTRRELLHLEGHRWMSISNAGAIKRRLIERGRLALKLAEESYRKMSQWRNLPAAYTVVSEPEAGLAGVSGGEIFGRIAVSLDEARRRLRPGA
jgi:hypothetical protein